VWVVLAASGISLEGFVSIGYATMASNLLIYAGGYGGIEYMTRTAAHTMWGQ
jgi:hypothetical protein